MYTHIEKTNDHQFNRPDILSYQNSVKYLNDYYQYRKNIDSSFSYEQWAKESGNQTRSHMRLVSLGQRRITDDFIQEYCKYHNFTDEEVKHFYLINYYNESSIIEIKKNLLNAILENHEINHQEIESQEYKDFLSKPVYGTIQALLGFKDIEFTLSKITEVTRMEKNVLEDSLALLLKIVFIEEHISGSGEKFWKSKIKPFKIPDECNDALTQLHYKNLLESAEKVLNPEVGARCRSIMIPMLEENHEELKNDIEDFLRKIKAKYGSDEAQNRKLFKINLHAFPETEVIS